MLFQFIPNIQRCGFFFIITICAHVDFFDLLYQLMKQNDFYIYLIVTMHIFLYLIVGFFEAHS